MRLFRRPAMQPAYAGHARSQEPLPFPRQPERPVSTFTPTTPASVDFDVTENDRHAFEGLLGQVQSAFGREDYAALRELCTPEIVSYLSEELSQNATQGRRNEVRDVTLLQADVAEAWREDQRDYATAALRYQAIDTSGNASEIRELAFAINPDLPIRRMFLPTLIK